MKFSYSATVQTLLQKVQNVCLALTVAYTLRPSARRTLTTDWLLQWTSLQRPLATGHAWPLALGRLPALCRLVKPIQSTLFLCLWDWGRVAVKRSEQPMKLISNVKSVVKPFRSFPRSTSTVILCVYDQKGWSQLWRLCILAAITLSK